MANSTFIFFYSSLTKCVRVVTRSTSEENSISKPPIFFRLSASYPSSSKYSRSILSGAKILSQSCIVIKSAASDVTPNTSTSYQQIKLHLSRFLQGISTVIANALVLCYHSNSFFESIILCNSNYYIPLYILLFVFLSHPVYSS